MVIRAAMVIASAVLWSTAGVFVRQAMLGTAAITLWRSLFAAITLGALTIARGGPGRLLAVLQSRGLRFSLSADGKHIVMPPADAAALAPDQVAAIKQRKADIIAVLAAEAEAARPVVVA